MHVAAHFPSIKNVFPAHTHSDTELGVLSVGHLATQILLSLNGLAVGQTVSHVLVMTLPTFGAGHVGTQFDPSLKLDPVHAVTHLFPSLIEAVEGQVAAQAPVDSVRIHLQTPVSSAVLPAGHLAIQVLLSVNGVAAGQSHVSLSLFKTLGGVHTGVLGMQVPFVAVLFKGQADTQAVKSLKLHMHTLSLRILPFEQEATQAESSRNGFREGLSQRITSRVMV